MCSNTHTPISNELLPRVLWGGATEIMAYPFRTPTDITGVRGVRKKEPLHTCCLAAVVSPSSPSINIDVCVAVYWASEKKEPFLLTAEERP